MTTQTKTKLGIPVGAIRWMRTNRHYIETASEESALFKAAADDYRNKFSRDLSKDLETARKGNGK